MVSCHGSRGIPFNYFCTIGKWTQGFCWFFVNCPKNPHSATSGGFKLTSGERRRRILARQYVVFLPGNICLFRRVSGFEPELKGNSGRIFGHCRHRFNSRLPRWKSTTSLLHIGRIQRVVIRRPYSAISKKIQCIAIKCPTLGITGSR